MRFLLDVCVSSRSLSAFLAAAGHDVLSALAVDPRASDERLLERALRDGRVLVTEDKDFWRTRVRSEPTSWANRARRGTLR